MINTSAFIEGLTAYLNTVKEGFSVFYDKAPSKKAFPYGVISGVNESSLGEGYLTSFDLDLWTDDKLPTATEEIEELCDIARNALNNKVLSSAGVYSCHIGYEGRDTTDDREDDISHRRIYFAARIFYN